MTDAELRRLLPAIRSYCETNKRPVPQAGKAGVLANHEAMFAAK